MKIALIHDWLNQIGGAEDVLETLVEMFPAAPIFTSIYWREKMPAHWRRWNIKTSFMDSLPLVHRFHQPYLFLYRLAFQSLDLSGFDIILSNKSGFCHGVRKPRGAAHICYCLTPTRYVWGFDEYAAREGWGATSRQILRPALQLLKQWDKAAASGVDHFIAISSEVQRRIARFYDRESIIIYPPVNTDQFRVADSVDDYFLCLGRLIPYKRVDLAVQACTELNLPLLVAGDGRDRTRLERMAGSTVKFLGRVPDADVPALVARCRAFIFPGLEDFGIAPVQAMAAGRPVIAFAGGGALDTVIESRTGRLFHEQTVQSLISVLKSFDPGQFDPQTIRAHALKFDRKVFETQLRDFINSVIRH
ncbi:MAG: glycosyltransferase family 4 protein [Chloroflexi bacterium]|nr:glycosyltransferase family 4 protein [Chloroflexota bacterium]